MPLCPNDPEWMPYSLGVIADFPCFRWLGHSSRNSNPTLGRMDSTHQFIAWLGRARQVACQVEEAYSFCKDRIDARLPGQRTF